MLVYKIKTNNNFDVYNNEHFVKIQNGYIIIDDLPEKYWIKIDSIDEKIIDFAIKLYFRSKLKSTYLKSKQVIIKKEIYESPYIDLIDNNYVTLYTKTPIKLIDKIDNYSIIKIFYDYELPFDILLYLDTVEECNIDDIINNENISNKLCNYILKNIDYNIDILYKIYSIKNKDISEHIKLHILLYNVLNKPEFKMQLLNIKTQNDIKKLIYKFIKIENTNEKIDKVISMYSDSLYNKIKL